MILYHSGQVLQTSDHYSSRRAENLGYVRKFISGSPYTTGVPIIHPQDNNSVPTVHRDDDERK